MALPVNVARAQTPKTVTDLPSLVNDLLNKFGPVPVTTTTNHSQTNIGRHTVRNEPHGEPFCGPVLHIYTTTQTVQQIPATTSLNVSTSQPTFGTPIQTSFPDQLTAWDIEEINCGEGSAQASAQFNETVTHSSSVALTHSITNSTTVGLSLSSGSLGGVGGPSVSASLSFGKSANCAGLSSA
jgi:hypothetical protein